MVTLFLVILYCLLHGADAVLEWWVVSVTAGRPTHASHEIHRLVVSAVILREMSRRRSSRR